MEQKTPWIKNYGDIPTNLEYTDDTMWQCFLKSAEKVPDFSALSYMGKEYSYSRVKEKIESVARAFSALGVTKGTRVAICLPNIPQAIYCLYALNILGAAACMVHPLSAEKELTELLSEADCRFAVIMDSFAKKFGDAQKNLPQIRYIVTDAAECLGIKSALYKLLKGRKLKHTYPAKSITWKSFIKGGKNKKTPTAVKADKSRPAVILFSGGTTGVPKAIALSDFNVNAMGAQINAVDRNNMRGNRTLAVLPIFHGFGLGVCIHSPLYNCGTSVLVPRANPAEFAKLLESTKTNVLAAVPSLLEALTRNPYKPDLSRLLAVYSGGDSMSVSLKQKLNAYLKENGAKIKVQEGYGATECFAASCLTPYFSNKVEGIGFPLPDMLFKICSPDTREELPYNTDGEICVSGPTVMLGYLGHSEENAKALQRHADGKMWLHTGDMGCMDEDGCVYFRQRIKRMIITNGYNVYPARIEQILEAHPKVRQSCVIGVADPKKIQRVKAFVVTEKEGYATEELKAELFEYCKKHIAKYALPTEIEFRKELPKTKLNKTDYKALEAESAVNRNT